MSGTCRYTTTGDLECIYSKTPQVTPDNQVTFQSTLITETRPSAVKPPVNASSSFNEALGISGKTVAMLREQASKLLNEAFENAPPKCTAMCNGADAACIAFNLDQGKCTR